MTYDHWKTTNPDDEAFGEPPLSAAEEQARDRDDWLADLEAKYGHIRAVYEFPPIPDRSMDWYAVLDDVYDGAPDAGPQFMGWGRTRDEAIRDLIAQLEEDGR